MHQPKSNSQIDYLMNFFKTFSNSSNGMNVDQIEKCFDNVCEVLSFIHSNDIFTLPTDQTKVSLFAEVVALLRNQVGLANDNERNALLILKRINEQDILHNLLHQFSIYSEYIQHRMTTSSEPIDELFLVTLLRMLQLFHNLLNLNFTLKDNHQIKDFVDKFFCLFDFRWLSFILGLYDHKQYDDQLNNLLEKFCYLFTSNLYCCLKNSESIQRLILMDHSTKMVPVWQHILNHIKLEISEWSLWIIFLGLKRDNFFEMLYIGIDDEHRLLLLDIVSEFIEGEHKIDTNKFHSNLNLPEDYLTINQSSSKTFPCECVKFIMNLFKSEITSFLQLAQSGNIEILSEDKIRLVCKLSSLLLKVSSINDFREIVQQDNTLLQLLVNLLKNIQLLGKANPDSVFAPRSQLKDVSQEETEIPNPAYGFKRDIIGLIANVTYKNYNNQEYLRTSDGLAALLDCAKIDARNPFILQWSIFAIRNALETNSSNQQFVAQMNQQGILKDDLLNRIQSNSK